MLCFGVQQPEFGLSGLALNPEPKSVEFLVVPRRNSPVWRLEGPPLSGGSGSVGGVESAAGGRTLSGVLDARAVEANRAA